jgi:hypothetical protein
MYMAEVRPEYEVPQLSVTGLLGLAVAAVGILYLGVLPSQAIELAAKSVETIF